MKIAVCEDRIELRGQAANLCQNILLNVVFEGNLY